MIDTLDSARMIRCWFWRLGGLGGPVVEAVSACPCKFHRIEPLDQHEIGDVVLGAQKKSAGIASSKRAVPAVFAACFGGEFSWRSAEFVASSVIRLKPNF